MKETDSYFGNDKRDGSETGVAQIGNIDTRQRPPTITMKLTTRILLLAAFALYASADGTATQFREAALPPGVVTGYISVGGRTGAVVAGGRTVYPNDTFTVTLNGHTTTWKVLGIDRMRGRFAVETPENGTAQQSQCPQPTSDFAMLASMLEQRARAYSSATTRVQKDRVMSEAREDAKAWCASNTVISIRGELAECRRAVAGRYRIKLVKVAKGISGKDQGPDLYIHPTFEADISLSDEQALRCKAGDVVALRGKPAFRTKPTTTVTVVNGVMTILNPFTSFRMLADSELIGDFDIQTESCDVFDPAKETVRAR